MRWTSLEAPLNPETILEVEITKTHMTILQDDENYIKVYHTLI